MSPPVPIPPPAAVLATFPSFPPDFLSPIERYPAQDEAQYLIYDAWEAESPMDKFRLCEKALQKFPFTVDAYNTIASIYHNEWKELDKAMATYEHALACARMMWPSLEHQEEIAWGEVEHRPFLRTYHGIGCVALDMGDGIKAVECFRFLLKKNPSDNQGVRKIIFLALLEQGEYQEAEQIAEAHSDGRGSHDCYFRYGFLLMDFLKFKLGVVTQEKVEKRLVQALQSNNFVAQLLLVNDDELPESPKYVSPGTMSEAISYVEEARATWKRLPGNPIRWLEELRFRGGPKPDDDGSILFDLLTKGNVLICVKENKLEPAKCIEVTTRVQLMSGRGLDTFRVPPGMKEHDASKPLVCFATGAESSDLKNSGFKSFRYDSLREVPFWSVLNSSKVFGNDKYDTKNCAVCYEKAKCYCSRCSVVSYCSKACQAKDWKKHKPFCNRYIKT